MTLIPLISKTKKQQDFRDVWLPVLKSCSIIECTMAKKNDNWQEEPLEKQLWKAADKLRKNIDAAEYKHVVLGLIFLKYISDAFEGL